MLEVDDLLYKSNLHVAPSKHTVETCCRDDRTMLVAPTRWFVNKVSRSRDMINFEWARGNVCQTTSSLEVSRLAISV